MSKILKTTAAILLLFVLICSLSGCGLEIYGDLKYSVLNGEVTVRAYKDKTKSSVLEIPDEIEGMPVVKVDDFGAFNAESLLTIKIGKNVREIGGWAFTNNTSLKEFIVDANNGWFTVVDGVLFTKDMKTLVYYPNKKNVEVDNKGNIIKTASYTIPEGVETIRTKAFYKCANIETVILPGSLKTIEEKAFHRATALQSVNFPDGLNHIGMDAFAFCSAITEIMIPKSVTQIDEYAFYNCSSVKTVTILGKEETMTLGKKWYPTQNGRELDSLTIKWAEKTD